ncbi:MAG: nitroreductase [Betaproteobacteria bacterium]
MSVIDALSNRYSCRRFKQDAVPIDLIHKILTAAQKTPSWCNTQPWGVHVVSGKALQALSEKLEKQAASGATPNPDFSFPERYEGDYRDRRKVCGLQLYKSVGIEKGDAERTRDQALENFRFFAAPHVMFLTVPSELGVYGAVDCGLYVSSFMLVANELGVATIAQAALASYPDVVREALNIGKERHLVCGISFGFEDTTHPINGYRTERESIASVVKFIQ